MTCLALSATVVVVAGCGGGGHSSSGSTATPVTKARAVAFARAVNLRGGDVPGMSTTSKEGETSATDVTLALARCGGGLPGWETGSLRSSAFQTNVESKHFEPVWSAIRVASSPAVAMRPIAADRTPRFVGCFARAMTPLYRARGLLVQQSTSASVIPTELPGVAASFGLRLTHRVRVLEANPRPPEHNFQETLRRKEGDSNVDLDVVGFASGPVEIAVTYLHEVGVPASQAERRLLALLYSRAKAHKF